MRSAGAAILGAAVVGLAFLATSSNASAAEAPPDDSSHDDDVQAAMNYYAQALTNPVMWSDGQLKSLEGILNELGAHTEAANIRDMRIGLYGDTAVPPEPLPDINFIPPSEIEAIADQLESEQANG